MRAYLRALEGGLADVQRAVAAAETHISEALRPQRANQQPVSNQLDTTVPPGLQGRVAANPYTFVESLLTCPPPFVRPGPGPEHCPEAPRFKSSAPSALTNIKVWFEALERGWCGILVKTQQL